MGIFSRFLPKRKPVEIKNNVPKEKKKSVKHLVFIVTAIIIHLEVNFVQNVQLCSLL